MLEKDVRNLVFSSTYAIYGTPERLSLTEDLPKRPVSVYGRSKLVWEQVLENISKTHVSTSQRSGISMPLALILMARLVRA